MIVGGGLSADNNAIYRAFIDATSGMDGTIAIIPSASAEPQTSADSFVRNLVRHGIDPAQIVTVQIAERDDPATPVDEARWTAGASDPAEVAKIEAARAIWFTGGDQLRITRLLMTKAGRDTPALNAIRKRLAAGAVVGGTSAGAAIMGSMMIACGDPEQASRAKVSFNPADCNTASGTAVPLVLTKALGFLPRSVVDQHFTQRFRGPRLLRAFACTPERLTEAWGVDEDTALVADLARRERRVVGRGAATRVRGSRKAGACSANIKKIGGLEPIRRGRGVWLARDAH